MKKGSDSEPVCNKKYLKTEKYSYEGRIDSNFHGDKVPKDSSQCTCLSVVLIDSIFRIGENYYPQVFLKECKYITKEKRLQICYWWIRNFC